VGRESGRAGAGDAKRVDQRVFIQPKQLADGGCGTERALHGRIMKSAFRFDARALDPAANLASENQSSEKRLATQVVTFSDGHDRRHDVRCCMSVAR